ncbi:hypothetical protein ALT_9527 [Aspergillus lentulus]|uniref:Uncharacterized protein n=1 Tax=Aspergillus lentulus TaxID=293939 RepID=A0AAN4PTR0_ASPLE|nr:hypothetical protein ALT_9527 [Aspergillus lentulus]
MAISALMHEQQYPCPSDVCHASVDGPARLGITQPRVYGHDADFLHRPQRGRGRFIRALRVCPGLVVQGDKHEPLGKPYQQNLRKVYMINLGHDDLDDRELYVAMDFIECLAMLRNLPSLEWIGTDVLAEDDNEKSSLEAKSSNVPCIASNHSCVPTRYLAPVIRSCGVLKEFEYSIGGRGLADGTHAIFNPKTFILSVLEHRSTLEKLDLDAEGRIYDFRFRVPADFEFDGEMLEPRHKPIGKNHFNLLLYFAAEVNNENESKSVSLVEYLPPNLEYLCIKGYEKGKRKHNDAQMDALKALVASGSTSLKEIHGIDECIPNEDIELLGNYPDLLWKLSDRWSDEEE